jgi:DHA2 family multidrug resistance protein
MIFDPPQFVRKTFASGLKLDYIGIGLLSVGLASLEILLDEGQRNDWFGSSMIVTAAVLAAVALVAVVIWELRQEQPVVDFRILANRNFALAAVVMYAVGFTLYGSTAILPIFLQTILGYTALLSGLVLSPGGIAMMIGMLLVGRLLGRFEARWLIVFGLVVAAVGLFQMSGFNLDVDFRTAMWARTIQALGMAFLFVPINTTAFSSVKPEKLGYATGLMNLFRNIGGSAGIAMITTIVARRQQFHQEVLVSHLTPLDGGLDQMLNGMTANLVAHGATGADATVQAQGLLYGLVQRHAAMLAMADTFWVLALVFLALIPLVLCLRMTPAPRGAMIME